MSAPSGDLDAAQLAPALGDRPTRTYPALLSTEAAAMAWAREGAPSGAVVVAGYQAAPRGRSGLPWTSHLGRGLGFTLLHRESASPPRPEGWAYVAALLGLHDVVGGSGSALAWPDEVLDGGGQVLARLGVRGEQPLSGRSWACITVLVEDAAPPRAALLASLLQAVEARLAEPPADVLDAYRARCSTLGRVVRARMLPLGPDGPQVVGEAVDVRADGALVVRTPRGACASIHPRDLGFVDDASETAETAETAEPPERMVVEAPPHLDP